ncbi:DUF2630 family protein [Nocardiopsis flavescens]|uniref:DUF2630 family protein n=1 Tax=Nocardiopsis flavescens TaxID=758803 RepID=A0A1M6MED9_9ACTN|nr:DUF2630 family protein [Nocardiopsis flavescens]SHJ81839.1 Protein of unknown function [Nocardiopsis flavescens]
MEPSADNDILSTIRGLMDEEHALRDTPGGLSAEERGRMKEVEQALDQCWDLLRQRRAREEHGQDPEDARARPVSEVENYRQ